jgi:uncharacterized protein YkwD
MRQLLFLMLLFIAACTTTDTPNGGEDIKPDSTNNTTGNTGGSTGNTGGSTGNTGGSTGNTGGSTGNTGGSTGNTGGSTGNTGGSTGNTGGSTGNTGGSTGNTGGSTFPAETGVFTTDMLAYVNALRTRGCTCGGQQMPPVPALKWHKLLENAALRHATDMNTKKFFSHTGSDGSTMQVRVEATGYRWAALGENIAYGYTRLPDVINGWVTSAGHCRNMMSANYTELGASRQGNYWVQNFGKSR